MTKKRLYAYAALMLFSAQLLLPVCICCAQEQQEASAPVQAAVQPTQTPVQPTQTPVQQAAPQPVPQAPEQQEKKGMNLLQLIKYGGIVGHTIIVLSFVAVALSIEYAYTIRPAKLAPPKDIAVIKKLIREGKVDEFKKWTRGKCPTLPGWLLRELTICISAMAP